MAGMPKIVIERANAILKKLEREHEMELEMANEGNSNGAVKTSIASKLQKDDYQLSIFQLNDPVLQKIKEDILNTDINTLTPVEALLKLNEIKRSLGI